MAAWTSASIAGHCPAGTRFSKGRNGVVTSLSCSQTSSAAPGHVQGTVLVSSLEHRERQGLRVGLLGREIREAPVTGALGGDLEQFRAQIQGGHVPGGADTRPG